MTMTILFWRGAGESVTAMAEGFARARDDGGLRIAAAGAPDASVHPMAVRAMAEVGVDISAPPDPADVPSAGVVDIVLTACRASFGDRPAIVGNPEWVCWGLQCPSDNVTDSESAFALFRQIRDEVRRLVDDFFDRGYRTALEEARRTADTILNTISDGVMAHDLERRIFYFNAAAEAITGYSRDDVLGKLCGDIFPGNLCGGKCLFVDPAAAVSEVLSRELDIVTKEGETRTVHMKVHPLRVGDADPFGVAVVFGDITRERMLARRVGEIQQFSGIIGRDQKMLEVFDLIRDLADANVPVLIEGESGTGKELVAAAIHNEGIRAKGLFVPVNCGALPESLLESELFGHVKGAFTGAIRDKKGRFELADGGTIFLDEIGDISPAMQVKLLRVLQEGTFERVGSERTIRVDVRIVSATNKDLSEEISMGNFREDLYYRLNVVPILLPPLRDRRNDIPALVEHVLSRMKADSNQDPVRLADETMDVLLAYDWPGNVRELQNWLQYALVKCRGDTVLPEHLPPPRGAMGRQQRSPGSRRKLTGDTVKAALNQTRGNKLEAAKVLNISRATLYRFLEANDML